MGKKEGLKKNRCFLKPNWKKIFLTLLIIIFFYFIGICFPSGIFSTPSEKKVLENKPYCSIVRDQFFSPILNLFSGFFLWFPLYITTYLSYTLTKSLIIGAIIMFFYFLGVSYILSCLLLFFFEKLKLLLIKEERKGK